MPKWPEMYSDVEAPRLEAGTWDDLIRLSHADPVTRHAVMMVARGDITREQALIGLAFANYQIRRQMFHAEVERRSMELPRPIILQK